MPDSYRRKYTVQETQDGDEDRQATNNPLLSLAALPGDEEQDESEDAHLDALENVPLVTVGAE